MVGRNFGSLRFGVQMIGGNGIFGRKGKKNNNNYRC